MGRKLRSWIVWAALAADSFRKTEVVLAVPHEVTPVRSTTDSLSLVLYVKSSRGNAHFIAVPSSAKVVPTSVTPEDIVDPSRHEILEEQKASFGSFPVRESERRAYTIDGLSCGEAYDVFFVIEAANSNGLFGPVGRALGVSTNGAAPPISALSAIPLNASTNATQMRLSMDAPGVSCRIWYTVTPLRDAVLLEVEELSADQLVEAARPDNVIDLPKGLDGELSQGIKIDGLESDTWYQVSAVPERAEGIFSEPIFAIVKTHRDPPTLMESVVEPATGSIDSLELRARLDCSDAPIGEECGVLTYRLTETPPSGSPEHVKPRDVTQGTVVIADGRMTSHKVSDLSPGQAYVVTMKVETPGSNGAFGPSSEVAAMTFPRAPILNELGIARSSTQPSTVTVHYKLSEPGMIHVSLVERIGHPLAMMAAMVGNQHGISFSLEVGLEDDESDNDDDEGVELGVQFEGSQELNNLAAGSAFDVAAHTEALLLGRRSEVYGVSTSRVVEAVPPALSRVRINPPDATTTQLLLEYEVLGTTGLMYHALMEAGEAADKEKDSLANSPEAIKSAVRGSGGILAAGLTPVSPSTSTGMATTTAHSDISPGNQLLFAGLEPKGRYTLYLCTESNSGSLSGVTVTEAMVHSEAPLITEITVTPTDRSAEAITLAVGLESAGFVHFAVRRAEDSSLVASRDHTVVARGTREVNGTSFTSSRQDRPVGGVDIIAAKTMGTDAAVLEMIQGLEPNVTYEVFIATETIDSNGVYRAKSEPVLVTTHPVPPLFKDAYASAADASSSALRVTVSLAAPAEVHYALFATDGDNYDHAVVSAKRGSPRDLPGGGGEMDVVEGCRNGTMQRASASGPARLNGTLGLVVSGVLSLRTSVDLFTRQGNEQDIKKSEHFVEETILAKGMTHAARTTQDHHVGIQPAEFRSSRVDDEAIEGIFRVDGLEPAKAYDVCLFTETPGSNGLYGDVHELRAVRTHAPIPELALEQVACTLDCKGFHRDPCWLKADRCGECIEGFVGKAGHVNSPCGKTSSLTEADVALIAERERQEKIQGHRAGGPPSPAELDDGLIDGRHRSDHDHSEAGPGEFHSVSGAGQAPPNFNAREGDEGPTALLKGDDGQLPLEPRLLLGVPVSIGPNLTEFLYVEVAEEGKVIEAGEKPRAHDFDQEVAATKICEDLREQEKEPPACKSHLVGALASRFNESRFHREDDRERPILQVEIDAPSGEALAFMLLYGQEAGPAAVAFCRDNQDRLPDEQACVIALIQEMSL